MVTHLKFPVQAFGSLGSQLGPGGGAAAARYAKPRPTIGRIVLLNIVKRMDLIWKSLLVVVFELDLGVMVHCCEVEVVLFKKERKKGKKERKKRKEKRYVLES